MKPVDITRLAEGLQEAAHFYGAVRVEMMAIYLLLAYVSVRRYLPRYISIVPWPHVSQWIRPVIECMRECRAHGLQDSYTL